MMHSDQCIRHLFELLKEFCLGASLGPTVEFGVNASPFAVFDGQGPPAQPIGKRMKDSDKECSVVFGEQARFPKWTAKLASYDRAFFRREEKTPPARCWFFFSVINAKLKFCKKYNELQLLSLTASFFGNFFQFLNP